jgi:Pyridine nucleotide-disulphide oxidoreductase, dimerisation domain
METNLRAHTISETRGFVKALMEADSDRILGFTAFGVGAGETLAAVQIAMIAGLPYTALRDAVLTHPTPGRRSHISVLSRGVSAQRCRYKRSPDLRRIRGRAQWRRE